MTLADTDKGPRLRTLAIRGAAPLLISVIGIGVLATLYGMGRYDAIVRDTRMNLMFNAALTAQGLDANLRIADLILENSEGRFARLPAPSDPGLVSDFLLERARQIGVVDNVYLLDSDWNVVATAFARISPTLVANPDLRARLRGSGGSEAMIVDCSAEGGAILALLRTMRRGGATYVVAALFSGSEIAGRLEALRSWGGRHIAVQDHHGALLSMGGNAYPSAESRSSILEATASLPSYPVKVIVGAARDDIMIRWFTELRSLILAMAVFCAAAFALAFFNAVLRKRRLQVHALEDALEADATLFREINHRIKNNLVVVESVLDLGVAQYEDGARSAQQILESAKDRIHSISLVHELLYKGTGTKNIVLSDYVGALRAAIGEAYDPEKRIRQSADIDGTIELNFDIAVPCGMILSELITNAYKYAFPLGREGTIGVSARRGDGDIIELVVRDDGVGFASAASSEIGEAQPATAPSGLGTMLIAGLADQLHGTIERVWDGVPGTAWSLRFPVGNQRSSDG